ncbi:MAG: hypothetical protein V3R99_00370 [Thermoguttaceae bacterium]
MFGRVIEGMNVVKAIEAQGSRSGRTAKPIAIVDSGELKKKPSGSTTRSQ